MSFLEFRSKLQIPNLIIYTFKSIVEHLICYSLWLAHMFFELFIYPLINYQKGYYISDDVSHFWPFIQNSLDKSVLKICILEFMLMNKTPPLICTQICNENWPHYWMSSKYVFIGIKHGYSLQDLHLEVIDSLRLWLLTKQLIRNHNFVH